MFKLYFILIQLLLYLLAFGYNKGVRIHRSEPEKESSYSESYEENFIEDTDEYEMFEINISDDFTVTRPDVSGYKKLGWLVKYNGEQVLHRNAENELSYQYFVTSPGTYEIYVIAWINGKYVPVSNTVTYTIK